MWLFSLVIISDSSPPWRTNCLMYPEFHLYITHQAVSLKLDRRTSLLKRPSSQSHCHTCWPIVNLFILFNCHVTKADRTTTTWFEPTIRWLTFLTSTPAPASMKSLTRSFSFRLAAKWRTVSFNGGLVYFTWVSVS